MSVSGTDAADSAALLQAMAEHGIRVSDRRFERAVADVLTERDSLRARLAAQQPVIDAAIAWFERQHEATEVALVRVIREQRAALSGSVEAADTPAKPEWEVYVTATGSPTGATYDEFGDAQVHVEALNELSGKRRYDIRRAKSREAADTPPSGTSGHEADTPAEPEQHRLDVWERDDSDWTWRCTCQAHGASWPSARAAQEGADEHAREVAGTPAADKGTT